MTSVVPADASMLPAQFANPRRRPTQRMRWLRPVAVAGYRLRRWLAWHSRRVTFASVRSTDSLPVLVRSHASPLLRQLGASEMWLQHNKVVNLRLAAARIDGLLIRPGETFSFCRLVGRTTRRRGYLPGMMLEAGETVPGVGGGICQLANMIHWLALHSPLNVTQRSTHSEDPFPDEGRTVPWGTGCTIFYNYVDLQLRNDTPAIFQLRIRVGDENLHGSLHTDVAPSHTYRVYARNEHFLAVAGKFYRTNEIWRDRTDTLGVTASELVNTNFARTLYDPTEPAP
jgi:vancomycin resistance protein VanW